jgi:trigger factor
MSVVLSVEETGPCEKQLKVEVPAATVDAETARIAAEFRKQAKVPGFRKGKVPMELVRKRFGDEIEQEVVERLLPRYWRQAEAELQLDPLSPPAVEDVVSKAGEPLVFTAKVEVRPQFGLENLEGFDLPSPPTEADDEEVDRMIEDLRRAVAPWVEVDRPAAQGDLIEAQLVQLPDAGVEDQAGEGGGELESPATPEAQPVSFEVGDQNVWEELSLEVTGKSKGQTGTFSRAQEPGGASVSLDYSIEIAAVKERDLPPLDDELAAKIGKFSTLEELRTDVTGRLGEGKTRERRRLREQALLDQLRERNPTDLPLRVLEGEIRQMLTDYAESLGSRGVDPEQAGVDWQQLGEQVRPQAEARVHARLLLDAVAQRWEIEVPEEIFEATLSALARSQGKTAAQLRRALDADGRLGALRAQLRRERALNRLLGEKDVEVSGFMDTSRDGAAEEE